MKRTAALVIIAFFFELDALLYDVDNIGAINEITDEGLWNTRMRYSSHLKIIA